MSSKYWIGVDWGTSSLRVARFENQKVIEERSNDQGIMRVPSGGFKQTLQNLCADWLQDDTRVLISGMAGSTQGWALAPYCPCPANAKDIEQHLLWIEPQKIAIVPGLVCEHAHAPDVMRGEEVQIFGALQLLQLQDATIVLPGTHSKWVRVDKGRIMHFETFMTGEVFAALRSYTILSRTLPTLDSPSNWNDTGFDQGVALSLQQHSLLHTAFSTRTLSLLQRNDDAFLLSYLSGLVIGEEIRAQHLKPSQSLVVIASDQLQTRYQRALQHLGCAVTCIGNQATWAGLSTVAQSIS
ncbi:MAG: 2-dehydro-3-deoxygalactonokinase [Betaproteobacteria bacterium]|jgi:2-dehydro-3-deoxygalactonokinase|nr:2-dehydro-3-deoxygalactonokinase [Betaproteobacteria bacterium]NBT67130.1 2-dehydro-3-deoxygalactonokinase [Betaproteobacteria bacterium]NBY08746.1 2-dehydro-3-deoxygalactonokinase [Betaproteobacteria bacterium]